MLAIACGNSDGDQTHDWEQVGGQVSPAGAESEDPTMLVIGTTPAVGYRQESFRTHLNIWTGSDEADWLGWLGITEDQLKDHLPRFERIAKLVKDEGFTHLLLLGMGGSSLCPEVFKMTFGTIDGFPELLVLDSTDPAQVRTFEGKVDLEKTLFIVASKSGTTLEPNAFMQYFYERVKERVGADQAGHHQAALCIQAGSFRVASLQLGAGTGVRDAVALQVQRPVRYDLVGCAHRHQRAAGDKHLAPPLSEFIVSDLDAGCKP